MKWLALLVACAALYIYWERRDIGRYEMHVDSGGWTMTDTKTGIVWIMTYAGQMAGVAEINPKTGTTTVRKMDITPVLKTAP